MMSIKVIILILCLNIGLFVVCGDEEFYKLLGISKTATTREIRQAFKKIALVKHPDKNQHDPTANENFIKINRAYEILKDDELRKKYDLYGEKGLHDDNNMGRNYQSWNFYNQNFGIYDDDAEIITLSRSDFMQSVEGSGDLWFINFYSTQCSHCHELAPSWRELAKHLDGVIRIGAVNCMDDWQLCNEKQIHAYPSLVIYPSKDKYNGIRTTDELLKYALSFTSGGDKVLELNELNFNQEVLNKKTSLWFISYCLNEDEHDGDNCLDELVLKKLAIMLNSLINVATINCNLNKNLCENYLKPKNVNIFYKKLHSLDEAHLNEQTPIDKIQYKEIAFNLWKYLPDLEMLNKETFKNALNSLKEKTSKGWLIQFVSNYQETSDLELRKLPILLSEFKVGRIDCMQLNDECSKYQITKYPTFILFKRRSKFEFHYGRQSAHDLAAFVKENAFTSVKSLQASDFPSILDDKKPAFIDFFAPWCPPCMNLLPQFRKAAKTSGRLVNFGTVDCTIHTRLCEQYNVQSYPSTILFNNTVPHQFHGQHSVDDLQDFIQDILNPSVLILNYNSFHELVGKRESKKMFLVDFFASWCGPCQQLAPEWRKLAKRLSGTALVGQVDCVIEQRLCDEQNVNSYPHIRLYPPNTSGVAKYNVYNQMWRDAHNIHQWAIGYLPSKTTMLDLSNFESLVIKSNDIWLIDSYAPWCGHCQVFAPTFETIATKLEGKVKCGKVNCQEQMELCQRTNIHAYPTIRYYSSKKQNWIGENVESQDLNFILNYINTKLKEHDEL